MQSEEAVYEDVVEEQKSSGQWYFIVDICVFLVAISIFTYLTIVSGNYYLQQRAIQIVILVLIGIVHVISINRSGYVIFSPLKKLKISLLLCLFIFLGLAATSFYQKDSNYTAAAVNAIAFLLPALVYYQWQLIDTMRRASNKNKIWYGFNEAKDARVTVYLNSISLHIKISKSYSQEADETFETTFPGHMILGSIFNKFLLEINDEHSMDLYDDSGAPYGWIFFEKRRHSYEVRCLDPELTVRENKVKDGSTIMARRVKNTKLIQ